MKSITQTLTYLSIISLVNSFTIPSFYHTSSTMKASNKIIVRSTTEEETESINATIPASSTTTTTTTTSKNQQATYGVSVELPNTFVRCGRCTANFALRPEDLGNGKGRRVECTICNHSWFQTAERLITLNEGQELIPLPPEDIERININIEAGRRPDYVGTAKFYVGNLDFGVNESDIRGLFAEVGNVGDVSLVTGPDGRSRGFAFVTMMDDDVTDACMKMDGTELKGRAIQVKPPNN